jgi:hypothetical protein
MEVTEGETEPPDANALQIADVSALLELAGELPDSLSFYNDNLTNFGLEFWMLKLPSERRGLF